MRFAPVAVGGAALSGLIGGAFYALVPVWMQDEGFERETIGLLMLVAVLGGLAFQIPLGRLSDRFDRRIVLIVLSTALSGAAIALVRLPHSALLILAAAALFGGLMSTLHPVCVAHAHDRLPADRVVAVSSRLILASGCGSVIGPLVGMSQSANDLPKPLSAGFGQCRRPQYIRQPQFVEDLDRTVCSGAIEVRESRQ